MSCDNIAAFICGLRFFLSEDMFMIENPLFGHVKYDPETGEKVEKYTKDKATRKQFSDFINNNYNHIFTVPDEVTKYTYFCGNVFRASGENYTKVPTNMLPSHPECYSELISMLQKHNIGYEEGNFLVSHMSC